MENFDMMGDGMGWCDGNLNSVTLHNKLMPNVESLFDKFRPANYFSILDLAKEFPQVLVYENDIEKTAFSTAIRA